MVTRGYIDIAHALLRHFEEALETRQRLTAGSLQCSEIVCKALRGIQDAYPRLELLVQRILMAIAMLYRRRLADERGAAQRDDLLTGMVGSPCLIFLTLLKLYSPNVL